MGCNTSQVKTTQPQLNEVIDNNMEPVCENQNNVYLEENSNFKKSSEINRQYPEQSLQQQAQNKLAPLVPNEYNKIDDTQLFNEESLEQDIG